MLYPYLFIGDIDWEENRVVFLDLVITIDRARAVPREEALKKVVRKEDRGSGQAAPSHCGVRL